MTAITRILTAIVRTAATSLLLAVLTALPAAAAQPKATLKDHPGFAWGADVGGAIDLTGNNMSSINIDAYFGYRSKALDIAGIGAGINMMVGNSARTFPVYAILRTNFSARPTLLFAEARVGCVFNNLGDNISQTRLFLSPGIGVNLARGRTFGSYIIVSYLFNGMSQFTDSEMTHTVHTLSMACLRFGITF